jgi:flagellar hook-length control protein FliK
MNTIPPVAPAPQPSEPSQGGAASSTDSAASGANSQNFAGALREAGGKPGHKNSAPKTASSHANGSDLPAVGNQLPPLPKPLPLATSVVAPLIQSDAKAAKGAAPAIAALKTQIGVPGLESGAAPSPSGVAGGASVGSSPLPLPPFPGAAVSSAATAPSDTLPTGAASSVAGSVPASTAIPKIPAADTSGVVNAGKSQSAAPGNGAGDLEKAGPVGTAADRNASAVSQTNSAPPPIDDADSQLALAASAAGLNAAPPSDSSPTKDNSATADADAPANGALPIAPAAATAATVAAISAKTAIAAVAATAASIAQLHLSDTREAAGADKKSRDSSADLSLSSTMDTGNDGSAGAAQLLSTVNSPAASTPQPILKVAAGVDSAEFGQGVADRVSLMMGSNLTSAKLQVNPPALGPIEVRIALQGGHAQVWLTSHSAVTRDALESSSPKLREMLGAQGFGQVSVDISQRSFQERTPQPQTYDAMPLTDRAESISAAQPASSAARTASGFLDAYA